MATTKKTSKKVESTTKKTKPVSRFPYLKEHEKDPAICKSCGKRIGQSFLIGGMCKSCNFKFNEITEEYRRGFKVNKVEVSTDIGDLF